MDTKNQTPDSSAIAQKWALTTLTVEHPSLWNISECIRYAIEEATASLRAQLEELASAHEALDMYGIERENIVGNFKDTNTLYARIRVLGSRTMEREICGQSDTSKSLGLSAERVGGCGREVSGKDIFRCVDCSIPYHKGCLSKHCASELETAIAERDVALAAVRAFCDAMAFSPSSVPGAIEHDLKVAYEKGRKVLAQESPLNGKEGK